MVRHLCVGLALVFTAILAPATAGETAWIWRNDAEPRDSAAHFRRTFELTGPARTAELRGVANFANVTVYLNGKVVAEAEGYDGIFTRDVAARLTPGTNVLAVAARDAHGPAGLFVELAITLADGKQQVVGSDAEWQASKEPAEGWTAAGFDAKGWPAAHALGRVADRPWGRAVRQATVGKVDDYNQWKLALDSKQEVQSAVVDGFQFELVRAAAPEEGSWISLCFDPKGRAYISREDQGILRLTRDEKKPEYKVETIDRELKECRGLLWKDDALYAHANESKGFYRLRDTDHDGQFEERKLLLEISGGNGHGRNDICLGPDDWIYAICGDSVDLPKNMPDRTSPLREARRGQKTREGYVYRMNKEGTRFELLLAGLRNPFGIDFHPDGEMFTYDADAEYDTGAPWYRPTRVQNLVSGADYGWRGVTNSWPPYYCDQPVAAPPNIDIGQGSPTAVMFGTRSNFPSPYREALFALDWAYGRVLAVHVTPHGASYLGQAETFLKGRPLNVTDIDFAPDGAMYLVTGGRKTQSGLYRVKYVGGKKAATEPSSYDKTLVSYATEMRTLRHTLENYCLSTDSGPAYSPPIVLKASWPHLDSPDPWIRYAARLAVEQIAPARWRDKALAEERSTASLAVLLSLVQTLEAKDLVAAEIEQDVAKIVARLERLAWDRLPISQRLTALRVYELCLDRLGKSPAELSRASIAARLMKLYPDAEYRVNRALSSMLVRLEVPEATPKTLALLAVAPNQSEQLHYIHVLRQARKGWTDPLRDEYARWLAQLPGFLGGEGMPTFAARIKADALASLDEAARARVEKLLAEASEPLPPPVVNRPLVKEWKLADLAPALAEVGGSRNLKRGREMFSTGLCIYCHRMGSSGGSVGPNLTNVAARFSRRDLLVHILEPSLIVSEAYQTDVVSTHSGKVHTGRIVPNADFRVSDLSIATHPVRPDLVVTVPKNDVESHTPSPASVMPTGLLSTLTQEEILDLLAYLERPFPAP